MLLFIRCLLIFSIFLWVMITTSHPTILSLFNLKLSLMRRLTRFLSTEFLILFFETARPRRAILSPFARANKSKDESEMRTGVEKTLWYSCCLSNLCCFVRLFNSLLSQKEAKFSLGRELFAAFCTT